MKRAGGVVSRNSNKTPPVAPWVAIFAGIGLAIIVTWRSGQPPALLFSGYTALVCAVIVGCIGWSSRDLHDVEKPADRFEAMERHHKMTDALKDKRP